MARQGGPTAAMLALLTTISPAAATATLTCVADDPSVSLDVQAIVGHAGSFNTVEAKAVIKSQGPGAKAVELADEHLVQRWTTGVDIRLRFFRAEPAYMIDLTIETRGRRDDEKERPGTYRLTFTDIPPGREPATVNRNGRASCTLG